MMLFPTTSRQSVVSKSWMELLPAPSPMARSIPVTVEAWQSRVQ